MSETPTGTDRVELTDTELRTLGPWNSRLLENEVERILAARVQALTAERDELRGIERQCGEEHGPLLRENKTLTDELAAARAGLAAANAKISKWAEDYKKLAHDCGGTELERQALAARCAELEAAVEQEITTRDQYADLLDRFAAAIPGDHGEHSSGNDPWTNALASAADLQATLDRVTAVLDEWKLCLRDPKRRRGWSGGAVLADLRAALTPEGKS